MATFSKKRLKAWKQLKRNLLRRNNRVFKQILSGKAITPWEVAQENLPAKD